MLVLMGGSPNSACQRLRAFWARVISGVRRSFAPHLQRLPGSAPGDVSFYTLAGHPPPTSSSTSTPGDRPNIPAGPYYDCNLRPPSCRQANGTVVFYCPPSIVIVFIAGELRL